MLHYTRQERLGRDKHYSLFSSFLSLEENKVIEYDSRGLYYKTLQIRNLQIP
jgi:hypothetical protein